MNCGIGGEELSSTSFLWILLCLLCVVSCCMDVLFGFFIRFESTLCCVYCCVVAKSGFLLRFESRPSVASLEVLLSHFFGSKLCQRLGALYHYPSALQSRGYIW